MTISGQVLPQSGIAFLSGQHGIGAAINIAGAMERVALADKLNEPEIKPMIARRDRKRLNAIQVAISHHLIAQLQRQVGHDRIWNKIR